MPPQNDSDESARGFAPIVTAVLVVVGFATRLAYGWEWDELELLHAAFAVAHGLVPYRDFFEHHAPLLPILLAPLARGGDGEVAALFVPLRAAAAGVLLAILAALVRLVRPVVGRSVAAWAAVVFLVACPTAGKLFELRPDWPALLCLLVAFGVILREARLPLRRLVGAGLLGGMALCLTQKALVPWLTGLAWVAAGVLRSGERRDAARRFVGLAIGTALPPLLVTAAFARVGATRALFEGVIGVNLDWPRELPWELSWQWASGEAVGALSLAAAAAVTAWRARGRTVVQLFGFLAAAGLAAFVTTPVPWEQAFLFLVAPWVGGLVVVSVERWVVSGRARPPAAPVAVTALLLGLAVLPWGLGLRLAIVWGGVSVILALLPSARAVVPSIRLQAALGAVVLPGIVLFTRDRLGDALGGRYRAQADFARRVEAALRPGEPVLALWDHVLPFRPAPTYHWFAHEGVRSRVGAARLDDEYVEAVRNGRTHVVIADAEALSRDLPRLGAYVNTRCAFLASGYAGSDAYDCDEAPASAGAGGPGDSEALAAMAHAQLVAGRVEEGIDLGRRALGLLPPGSPAARAIAGELSAIDAARPRSPAPAGVPNVLMVVVDTLRADHVGVYGYPRPTTPAIDTLAAGGVVFENAVSQAPWTAASAATLFTGLYPSVHGLNGGVEWLGRPTGPGRLPFLAHRALASSRRTLAEVLRAQGWRTAGFVSNVYMSGLLGLAQGFDVWADDHDDYADEVLTRKRRAARTNEAVFRWLDEAVEPFFLLVHYNDPHWPYDPPAPFGREWTAGYRGRLSPADTAVVVESEGRPIEGVSASDTAYLVGLYDGEISYVDSEVGRLLERLRSRRLARGLLTILTADHGEEFLDHGSTSHGYTLYEEQLHVPLVFNFPERLAPRRVAAQVQLLDVVPTVLDLLGLPPLPAVQGTSLGALAEGRTTVGPGDAFAEATLRRDLAMIRTPEGGKLIESHDNATALLFDLARDPGERHDLGRSAEPQRQTLGARLAAWTDGNRRLRAQVGEGDASGRAVLDEATRRRLEGLGYLR